MFSPRIALLSLGLLLAGGAVYMATQSEPTIEVFQNERPPEPGIGSEPRALHDPSSPADSRQRTAQAEVDTPHGAWIGIEFGYQVEFESTVEIRAGEATQTIVHLISGRQLVRIVDRTHEGFVAAYSWAELKCRHSEDGVWGAPKDLQELAEHLGRPVLVYHDNKEDPSGTQQGLRFTKGLTPTARNWARTLVASQRAPVSESHPDGVDLVEADANGSYRSRYIVVEHVKDVARVQRSKLEALDGSGWTSPTGAPSVSGEGTICFSRGWIESATWKEHSILEVEEASLRITSSFTADIHRTSVGVFEGDGLDGWTLEDEWRSFDGASEQAETLIGAADALDDELLDGADAGSLVQRLVALDLMDDQGAGALLAAEALAILISQDPSVLEALQSELSSGILPEGALAKILGAMASAGTPEAQATLRVLFMLPNPPSGLRTATTLALFQLESVTPETIATFRGVLSSEDSGADLRSTSWLLLGAFASTGSDPTLAAHLIEQESAALENGELISWLEALGNSRAPSVLQAASRHLDASDANTRLSAVRALRHLDSSAATQALVDPAGDDADPIVRAEAISLLARRTHPGTLTVLGELLSAEPQTSVRRAALEALAERGTDEEVQQLLSTIAASDPDGSVRAYALDLLTP